MSFFNICWTKGFRKKCGLLLKYFSQYHKRHSSDLALILIGGGKIDIPLDILDKVYDLGFIDKQDKYDAYAAAELLCQPSHNESFSLVIMESWLCGRPVLVNNQCAVTKNFVIESNGGLYFNDYFEFEGTVDYILSHKDIAIEMGNNGKKYVKDRCKTLFYLEKKHYPHWVQESEWPIKNGKPLRYIGSKRSGDLVQFIFDEVDTKEQVIIEQYY